MIWLKDGYWTEIENYEVKPSVKLNEITQCIGVAYTFADSTTERQHLNSSNPGYDGFDVPFSYFYKGNMDSLSTHGEDLHLRVDPLSGMSATHWPEAELALLLGKNHQIRGYCLANDLTAASIERRNDGLLADQTYSAKVWNKCGSIGPKFVPPEEIGDLNMMSIGLRIQRSEKTIYNATYSLSLKNREFNSIPAAIIEKRNSYSGTPPLSKRIALDSEGQLTEGTIIMLGTGIIVDSDCYCEHGDIITVYCEGIGELTNRVITKPL